MRISAYIFFLLSLASCTGASLGESPIVIVIDKKIWVEKSFDNAVLIWFSQPYVMNDCAQSKSFQINPSILPVGKNQMALAESCGYRHIIFSDGWVSYLTNKEKRALASHEAFHALVQIGATLKTNFDWRVNKSEIIDQEKINLFYYNLAKLIKQNDNNSCKKIADMYGSMNGNEKNLVNIKSHLEWPAEYYMIAKENLDENQYLNMRIKRMKFTNQDWLYVAGYYATKVISESLNKADWQRMYMNGDSILNILFDSLKCNEKLVPSDYRGTITISRGTALYVRKQ